MVLKILQEEKLIGNLEKSEFMKEELVYLGFVVSQGSMKIDKSKVEAILSWPTPRSIVEVKSFHGMAQFYRKFVKRFSEICAPMNYTIKGGMKIMFVWTKVVDESFKKLKKKVETQPILFFPSFEKLFMVECDASNIAVGVVLSQEGRPMEFFSEGLNEANSRHLTYDL